VPPPTPTAAYLIITADQRTGNPGVALLAFNTGPLDEQRERHQRQRVNEKLGGNFFAWR
jgi:hypothetical protein